MEPPVEGDDGRPARVGARELDRVLDGLGARVEKGRPLVATDRGELEQPLGERHVVLVRDDREVGVREALDLLLRGLDHTGIRVADVEAAHAACEVDKRVPVDIGDRCAVRLLDHDREVDRKRLRDDAGLALEDLPAPGPGDLRLEVDCSCRGHGG